MINDILLLGVCLPVLGLRSVLLLTNVNEMIIENNVLIQEHQKHLNLGMNIDLSLIHI